MISHLGSMIPVAAGCAFAFRQAGSDRVAINFIGEGGTSTGDFHEGLNMAAVWKLPLILVIENNRYAFSTPARLQYAARQLSDRGPGYGVAAETVDGNDPDAMAEAFEPRRGPRPRRQGADPDRGDARPHARPRRGGRLAEGRARRRAGRLPRRRSGARLCPPSGGGGGAGRRAPASGWRRGSPRWSRRAITRAHRRAAAGRRDRPAAGLRPRSRRGGLAEAPAVVTQPLQGRDHLRRRHQPGPAGGDGARLRRWC